MVLQQTTVVSLLLLWLTVCGTTPASAQAVADPVTKVARSVVRLSAEFCGTVRAQTATGFYFRHQGETGVMTALHAVAGCTDIRARGDGIHRDLKLAMVDIDRDVAWLLPTEKAATLNNAPVLETVALDSKDVRVIGYPRGVTIPLEHTLAVQPQRRVKLEDLVRHIPRLDRLETRNSPALSYVVINLSGPLQPGHSGAPIVDSSDRVVAIGNGGLLGGDAQVGWAFEIQEIDLKAAADVSARLRSLSTGSAASEVFSGVALDTVPSDDASDLHNTVQHLLEDARRAGVPPNCRTPMECNIAARTADNMAAYYTEIRNLVVEISDQFSAARWPGTALNPRPADAATMAYYKERVATAWTSFDRLSRLTPSFQALTMPMISARARFMDEFFMDKTHRPASGCDDIGLSTPGLCMPLDARVREASRKALRDEFDALGTRLGVAP